MPAAARRLLASARRLRLPPALVLGGLVFGGLLFASNGALAAQDEDAAPPPVTLSPVTPSPATLSPVTGSPLTLPPVTFQPAAPSRAVAPLAPLTAAGRVDWFINSTVGPRSLGVGVLSAAWGTAHDSPDEYGPSWSGFGKRYVVRLSGVAIGNGIEASLGAIWGEEPRYRRAEAGRRPGSRIAHAAKMTVMADRPDGRLAPAYARGIAIVGNNFITNAWRVDSQGSINDALSRAMVGVTGRFVGNLFDEFWPDILRLVRRTPSASAARQPMHAR
jgi:hypothetical protein